MATQPPSSGLMRIASYIALLLHVLLIVWIFLLGLLAPASAVYGLMGVWAVLLVIGIALLVRRSRLVLAIPVLMFAISIGVILFGAAVYGWTA